MARPDTDDGYFKLAYELDAALAAADFSKAARMVLKEVFAQCFGLAKRRVATLRPADLARECGKLRQFLERGVAELVKAGVLEEVGPHAFRFIKDYESWTAPDGSPRLTPAEVAWCAAAPRVGAPRGRRQAPAPQRSSCTPCNSSVASDATHQLQNGNYSVASSATIQLPSDDPPPHPPIKGPSVEERREKGEGSLRSPTNAGAGVVDGGDDAPLEHEGPDGVRRPIPPQVQNDPAEVERVAGVAEALFPGRHFGGHVSRYAVLFPVAWIERALVDCGGWREPLRTFSPIVNRLREWDKAGGPPPIEAPPLRVVATGTAGPIRESPALRQRREIVEAVRTMKLPPIDEEAIRARG